MTTFANTLSPTPFGVFDSNTTFQSDADNMVVFVKRALGDDILSVELTKKQIWMNFEQASFEFGSIINQYQARSQLTSLLGTATGSLSGSTEIYPRETLEFLKRQAEPYSMEAGVGGSYNVVSGAFTLSNGQQDYDLHTQLMSTPGGSTALFDSLQTESGKKTKLKVREVFHFSAAAAYRFFDSTSAINYLNNEFSFESFTPETIFYVLPVFEDILRAGQMDLSQRVRRSNYSYRIMGTKLRVYPTPTSIASGTPRYLWVTVQQAPDPLNPSYQDDTIYGVSGLSNVPFGDLTYSNINSIGKQWIRQYTLALCKILLGHIRSKFTTVPIPNAELTLNGDSLITQGMDDKDKLREDLKEMLETLTYDKLLEMKADMADNMKRNLQHVPMPLGMAIITG